MSLTALARPALASLFLNGAYNQLSNPDGAAPIVQNWFAQLGVTEKVPLTPRELVRANGAVMGVAGAGLALGVAPRACAAALAAVMVPTTLSAHSFWAADDPMVRFRKRNSFFANLGAVGGLLHVALSPRP